MHLRIPYQARLGMVAFVLTACWLVVAVPASTAKSGANVITIGDIAPFSGAAAAYGPPEAASMQTAINLQSLELARRLRPIRKPTARATPIHTSGRSEA